MMGVTVPIGLAATLLFQGLSFWLPMLAGVWISRRIIAGGVAVAIPEGPPESYWSVDADVLVQRLASAHDGLTAAEAARRLRGFGPNQFERFGSA